MNVLPERQTHREKTSIICTHGIASFVATYSTVCMYVLFQEDQTRSFLMTLEHLHLYRNW